MQILLLLLLLNIVVNLLPHTRKYQDRIKRLHLSLMALALPSIYFCLCRQNSISWIYFITPQVMLIGLFTRLITMITGQIPRAFQEKIVIPFGNVLSANVDERAYRALFHEITAKVRNAYVKLAGLRCGSEHCKCIWSPFGARICLWMYSLMYLTKIK